VQIPPLKVVFPEQDRREILQRIDKCLTAGRVAQGENVQEFEETFARYVGAKHSVAVSSGGAAIEVAMRLLDVKEREILVPTNTFAATAMGVILAGGLVRLVDVKATTFAASLESLKAGVTSKTVGVILVHIGGLITPEIEKIRRWCEERGLWLFEDAAHAHGSNLNGKMAGRFGVAAAYSFFSTKVVTSGEGGMIVTDDDDLARGARRLRDYGKSDPWVSFHTEIGANWRMAEFCAAVGLVHLKRLDEFIAWRENTAKLYTKLLQGVRGVTPVLPAGRSSWYKYIVLLPNGVDQDRVKADMKARGIGLSGGVYETPLHRQPAFQEFQGEFPVADDICRRHICLPLYYGMTEEEAQHVVEVLKEVFDTLKS